MNTNSSTKLSAEEMLQNISGYNRDNIKDHNLIIEAMKQYASQQREDEGVREDLVASSNSVELLKRWFAPPFWYDADSGGYIFDNNGHMIVEVRGWGRFTAETKDDNIAWDIQNKIGEMIASLLNRVIAAQECDATMLNSSTKAKEQNEAHGWKNLPGTIYLNRGDEDDLIGIHATNDFKDLTEVTWCQDKIHDSDIEYVLKLSVREQLEQARDYRKTTTRILLYREKELQKALSQARELLKEIEPYLKEKAEAEEEFFNQEGYVTGYDEKPHLLYKRLQEQIKTLSQQNKK